MDHTEDLMNAKMKAAQQYYGDTCANEVLGRGQSGGLGGEVRPSPKLTLREEAEQRFSRHSAELKKADLAIEFFRQHPEFDLFVQLVRDGVIQF